jgi:hypothetical protein
LDQFHDHRVVYKNTGTQNHFAQITIHRNKKCRMGNRYEPESLETKMADGPYMGEPAPNRGVKSAVLLHWAPLNYSVIALDKSFFSAVQ